MLQNFALPNASTAHCQCRLFSECINNVTSEELRKAYAVLGLQTSASDAEIKQAYQRYVKLYHPDLCHTLSQSNRSRTSDNNYEFTTNTKDKQSQTEANKDKLLLQEVISDQESTIRDRMAAGNEAYQLLRKMTFVQRQKTLSRTSIVNEPSGSVYYSSTSPQAGSFSASAPFMSNGSSFHCSPEEYERAQRVYYGEARALRKKTNKISNQHSEKSKLSTEYRNATMSTKEFNTFMRTSNGNTDCNDQYDREKYKHYSENRTTTNVSDAGKSNKKLMQPNLFYETLLKRFASLQLWMQNAYPFTKNRHSVTAICNERIKHMWHILRNKTEKTNTTHSKQWEEQIKQSFEQKKSHSPFFSLHYMTIDSHNLHRLRNMYSTEQSRKAESTHEHSQKPKLEQRTEMHYANNYKDKCDVEQDKYKANEPSNKPPLTASTNSKKSTTPFDKTQPCRLRYVFVNGVPQIVREELVTSSSSSETSTSASGTSMYCQHWLLKRLLAFFEQITPDVVIRCFTRAHTFVHRTVLDRPVVFPSWPISLYHRHVVLYASALAIIFIAFILLDSFVSAFDQ